MRYYIGTPGPDGATAETLAERGVAVVPGDVPPALAELMGDSVIIDMPHNEAAEWLEYEIGGLAVPVEPWERLTKHLGHEPTLGIDGPMWVVIHDGDAVASGATPGDAIQDALRMIEGGSF